MARIYPEALSNHVRNNPRKRAEVKLYDALCQQLGGSWVILYHVAWLGRTTTTGAPRDGETDFIIAHPDFGILLVEVKGGSISYQGSQQQWISRDRGNNEQRIDPFTQVMQCKYALLQKIKSLPGWSARWITIGHAVAFPDSSIAHISLPPDAPPEIIIDGRHLSLCWLLSTSDLKNEKGTTFLNWTVHNFLQAFASNFNCLQCYASKSSKSSTFTRSVLSV